MGVVAEFTFCTHYYVIPAAPTSHPSDHLPLPLPEGYVGK